jgi:ketosteroid isomerase-like protein
MSSDMETVVRLEREVGEALARCDVHALESYFDDDFVGINPLGLEVTKAEVLAQIRSSDYEPESMVNEVRQIRIFGHVAVVLATGTANGKYKGHRADMKFIYTRIWVNRGGTWQAVASHANPLPPAS